jgi:hypothetical protein
MNQSTVFMLTIGVGAAGLLAYYCYQNNNSVALTPRVENVKPESPTKKLNETPKQKKIEVDEVQQGKSLLSIFNSLI